MTGTVETRDGQERAIELDAWTRSYSRWPAPSCGRRCRPTWTSSLNAIFAATGTWTRLWPRTAASSSRRWPPTMTCQPAHLQAWLVRTFVTELGHPRCGLRGSRRHRRGTERGAQGPRGPPPAEHRAAVRQHLVPAAERPADRATAACHRYRASHPPSRRSCLLAASRALALGEFALARRWAEDAVRTAPDTDRRIRAEAQSLLGNIEFEQDKPAEAEQHYRAAAGLFEAVRDTTAVAAQLAAAGQMLLAQGKASRRGRDTAGRRRPGTERSDRADRTRLGAVVAGPAPGRGGGAHRCAGHRRRGRGGTACPRRNPGRPG